MRATAREQRTLTRWGAKTYFAPLLDELLKAHTPSLTERAEKAIDKVLDPLAIRQSYDLPDYADLAVRDCSCGVRLDGFYEYIEHLKAMARS